jgi:hypothetical protein
VDSMVSSHPLDQVEDEPEASKEKEVAMNTLVCVDPVGQVDVT